MPVIKISFSDRETMPDLLKRRAAELDITVEQLIRRFICKGMEDYETEAGPAEPGETLEDFLVKNGAFKE
ncbi:hypothetical protein JHC43_10865 [Marinobacter salarius]|uniref:hypothetical protein n=1 Tax=Marinobacter salarius TaxID=1420917 RepID=UPI0018F17ACB|nr:hypothetical protein [Marinobacter salarius]MBJ7276977.1 hypothetical protein [Marinobacter salarius]